MKKKATKKKPADLPGSSDSVRLSFTTKFGAAYHGDSKVMLREHVEEESVDLIMTSPPFGLVRKKTYGNADADDYLDWFRPFGDAFKRVLKPSGSLVIDIGGAWIPGQPTRSLYHYKLLIMLCEEFGFHLAQDFFWWNPAKLPTPAEWVTVRRVRVKDAINCVWWLSPTPWPKASNRRVLTPYSDSMKGLLKNGYTAKKRPSGHDISEKFNINNGASIPPNLLPFPNTDSNSHYLRYCKDNDLPLHPARYPAELPEYFIRMLTDPGDLVIDPFGGSCITGEVSERLRRNWMCGELVEEYLAGGKGRFEGPAVDEDSKSTSRASYSVSSSACLWNGTAGEPLPSDGGRTRPKKAACKDDAPKAKKKTAKKKATKKKD
ncbi:Modification methylase PvuII [Stieleria bergensis]|uniref:Methyltransferase n=1 Tax=Stieleria bergensis TaxID=2528025 RepID=A0A517T1Y1_9BACT|nr:Modification methylase PvuII [Planctomycetes bacterium SV_7m_r]